MIETRPWLTPGDWTPTGWGSQHRVRAVTPDPAGYRIAFVCQPDGHAAELTHVDRDAAETDQCRACRLIPGLGPLRPGEVGEIRHDPDTGALAVLTDMLDPADTGREAWYVFARPTGDHGPLDRRWVDGYTVAGWRRVARVSSRVSETSGEHTVTVTSHG